MRFSLIIAATIIFFGLASQFSFAQNPPRPDAPPREQRDFWDKIYIGGNLGLQFGTYTVVDLEPQIGYRITDRLTSGIGITYIYSKYTDPTYNYTFKTNIYGGSLFTRFLVYESLFAQVEYEQLSLEAFDYFQQKATRIWVPAFFVGGGYRQQIGERSSFQFLILYDIIQDRNSPFINPVIRVGFGFGF